MKLGFKKVKTEHTILSEFHPLLRKIENLDQIQRIIPWRIMRQQKGSSDLRFSISYQTTSGLKAKISKGSTSQELFIICQKGTEAEAEMLINNIRSTL